MSAYSEAWNAMDPATRTFYVNFASIRCQFMGHQAGQYDPAFGDYYEVYGHVFQAQRGFDVAARNFGEQLFGTGSFDPNTIIWTEQDLVFGSEILPFYQPGLYEGWWNPWTTIEQYAIQYPRAKYNVRKSYWTGAPRRRRNL